MTVTVHEIIFFSAIAIVNCQYDYYRPDIPANELGYNIFGRPFTPDAKNGGGEIPGKAGTDYPVFSQVPETGFRCDQQRYPGYYADTATGCQAFYICQRGGRTDSFLCPNGTIFNQEWFVCDWWYDFDCSLAEDLYSVNEQVVRSMEEADTRVQVYGYNSLGRSGNNPINEQLDFQDFPNFRNGFTPLNGRNVLSNGPTVEYGVPGVSGFESNTGRFKYNRGGSDFGSFSQRSKAGPTVFGVRGLSGVSGFPGAPGYRRNLFKGDGPLERSYLPPGK